MFRTNFICVWHTYRSSSLLLNNRCITIPIFGNIEECEHVTEMIRELLCGIKGFSMTEITDILATFLLINYIFNTKLM